MSKKGFFADQLKELANIAKEQADANEAQFLQAIRDGDLDTVTRMKDSAPGTHLTPNDQVKRYIETACAWGANAGMFKVLFEIYPKTLDERLLLDDEMSTESAEKTQHLSCFSVALATGIDCAMALIEVLKSIVSFKHKAMIPEKEKQLLPSQSLPSHSG